MRSTYKGSRHFLWFWICYRFSERSGRNNRDQGERSIFFYCRAKGAFRG